MTTSEVTMLDLESIRERLVLCRDGGLKCQLATDIPELIAEVEQLRTEIETMREKVEWYDMMHQPEPAWARDVEALYKDEA